MSAIFGYTGLCFAQFVFSGFDILYSWREDLSIPMRFGFLSVFILKEFSWHKGYSVVWDELSLGSTKEQIMRIHANGTGKVKIGSQWSPQDIDSDSEQEPDLKSEMMNHLVSRYGQESADDAEIAIYWFAGDYHGGQWSELYSILSTSPYRPGPHTRMESEGDMVEMMYKDLEEHFGKR